MGATGRGITELFGVDISDVDMILGSLGHSFAACGGFCAGPVAIVDHQRLSGQAYCFSASMPALLSVYALNAIRKLRSQGKATNEDNASALRRAIEPVLGPLFSLIGDNRSPLVHLCVNESETDMDPLDLLQILVLEARKRNIFLMRAVYVENQEMERPRPSIRLCISSAFSKSDMNIISSELRDSLEFVTMQVLLPT